MVFNNNNILIGAADRTEKIKMYNDSGRQIDTIDVDYEYNWHSESYYLNNKIYILMSCLPGIRLFDYTNKQLKYKLVSNNNTDVYHSYAIIEKIKEDLIIFDGDNEGLITLWNFNTGEMIRRIQSSGNKDKYIYSLYLLNENYLLSGGADNKLKLYDLNVFKEIKSFDAHSNWLRRIGAFKSSNEGDKLITMGKDKKIIVWN